MKKLYHIYDPNNSNRVTALLSETLPEFAINHIVDGQIDPAYDVENDCIIDLNVLTEEDKEQLCKQEIEDLRDKTKKEISSLLYEHTQKLSMRNIPIPEEIQNEYDNMRESYHQKKQAIYENYGITINP